MGISGTMNLNTINCNNDSLKSTSKRNILIYNYYN